MTVMSKPAEPQAEQEPNCVEGSPVDAAGLVHGIWAHVEPEVSGLRYEAYVCLRCGCVDDD